MSTTGMLELTMNYLKKYLLKSFIISKNGQADCSSSSKTFLFIEVHLVTRIFKTGSLITMNYG